MRSEEEVVYSLLMGNRARQDRWKRRRRVALVGYVALLMASWVWLGVRGTRDREMPRTPTGAERESTVLPGGVELSWVRWGEAGSAATPLILLHGGPSQGADFARIAPTLARMRAVYAIDLLGFGGSTRHVADYSILANARAVSAWMDELHIERAHVLGWSQGGGVALHLADLAPERCASVTLMASIGMQETEGSRSYAFEHARYLVGDALRRAGPWLVPQFGAIDTAPPAFTRFFADSDQRPLGEIMRRLRVPTLVLHGRRDFLVPHWAAVEHARAIPGSRLIMTPWSHFMPFLGEQEREQVAGWLEEFWSDAEVHRGGRGEPRSVAWVDLAPVPRLFGETGARAAEWIVGAPWWVVAGVLALLGGRRGPASRWTVALAAAMVVGGLVDYGVVLVALVIAAWVWLGREVWRGGDVGAMLAHEWRERARRGVVWAGALAALRPDLRGEVGRAVRSMSLRERSVTPPGLGNLKAADRGFREPAAPGRSTPGNGRPPLRGSRVDGALLVMAAAGALAAQRVALLVVALLVIAPIFRDPFHPWGEWGVVLGIVAARVAVGIADQLVTIPGRRMLRAAIVRARRFEFWPGWLVYPLLIPTWVRGFVRTGHTMAFTACNPGIEAGGGVVGESKYGIMARLRAGAERAGIAQELCAAVCETHLIGEGSVNERAARVDAIVRTADDPPRAMAASLRYPVILKPDAGYRGFSVRRIASRAEAETYFRMMPRPALLQALHAGPGEVGVVWVRNQQSGKAAKQQVMKGRVFSITLKEFPVLVGDGVRTVEELIWRHPRFRLQAGVFLERLGGAGRRLDVLGAGERMPLAMAGNHCQGTLFRDGAHLITPELERAVDELVSAFGTGEIETRRARRDTEREGELHVAEHEAPEPTGTLDMVRLDIRYADEAALKRGELEPNSIVELNGTLGESTNIYDPDKPLSWSLGVLREQWRVMYDLGGARAKSGVKPMSMAGFVWVIVKNYWRRRGSELAD